MKKKLIFAAAAIAMLASCSQNDLEAPVVAQSQQGDAIEFGTYLGKAAGSRTGWAGVITDTELKDGGKANGFGVFAYYTGKNLYTYSAVTTDGTTGQSTVKPNFMYNEHVYWSDTRKSEGGYVSNWTYDITKYWPNDVRDGAVDDQDNNASNNQATGDGSKGGNLTFFAYAPYVATPEASTDGITAFTPASTESDPIVSYQLAASGKNAVDLLWGTKGSTSTNVNGEGNAGVAYKADGTEYQKSILPSYTMNADLTKQKTNGVVDFAFKHALAKFGGKEGLQIKLDLDNEKGGETGGSKADATKVTVKSVKIVAKHKSAAAGDNKYYQTPLTGNFNLANGYWAIGSSEGTSDAGATTTYIINQNGTGPDVAGTLNDAIKEPASPNPTWASIPAGVLTSAATNVYANTGEAAPLIFIPGTYPELTVTVDYLVRTEDTKLAAGYSEVEQIITKKITFNNPVALNKYYKLLIHLGLTSVKFTATVSGWDAATSGTTPDADVYVPINVAP